MLMSIQFWLLKLAFDLYMLDEDGVTLIVTSHV